MAKYKLKENHRFDISELGGLKEALNGFVPVNVISYQNDPGYGYSHVILCLLEFREDGMYGICIYDMRRREFIEEPGRLEDFEIKNLQDLYRKYPKLRPSYFQDAWANRDIYE